MTRPSIIAFLSLAFVGGTFGAPREAVTVGNIHARVDVDSGRCEGVHSVQTIKLITIDRRPRGIRVTVNASTPREIPEAAEIYPDFPNFIIPPVKLCDAARKANYKTPCPIPKGDYTFEYDIYYKGFSFKGYTLETRGAEGSETLFCFTIHG